MNNETMDDAAAEAPAVVLAKIVKSRKAAKARAAIAAEKPKAKKAAAPKPKKAAPKKKAESKTQQVVALLTRKSGCTRAEVLSATGWTAISMQQVAKVAKLKLSTEKEGRVLRYYGRGKVS
jgi:transposase